MAPAWLESPAASPRRRPEPRQAAGTRRSEQQGDDRPRDQPEDGKQHNAPAIAAGGQTAEHPFSNTVACNSSLTNPGCPFATYRMQPHERSVSPAAALPEIAPEHLVFYYGVPLRG